MPRTREKLFWILTERDGGNKWYMWLISILAHFLLLLFLPLPLLSDPPAACMRGMRGSGPQGQRSGEEEEEEEE